MYQCVLLVFNPNLPGLYQSTPLLILTLIWMAGCVFDSRDFEDLVYLKMA